jgi:hypothetical protein
MTQFKDDQDRDTRFLWQLPVAWFLRSDCIGGNVNALRQLYRPDMFHSKFVFLDKVV